VIKELLGGLAGFFKSKADGSPQKNSGSAGDADVYLDGERRQVPPIEMKVLKAMFEKGGHGLMVSSVARHLGWNTGYGGVLNAFNGLSSRGLIHSRVDNVLLGSTHRQVRVYDVVAGCELRFPEENAVEIKTPAP